jgi:hypothetical protein
MLSMPGPGKITHSNGQPGCQLAHAIHVLQADRYPLDDLSVDQLDQRVA